MPVEQVLARLTIDTPQWDACQERYGQLHFANMSWVAHAFERSGLGAPETDRALFRHLTGKRAPLRFSMRAQLKTIRETVEQDPKIGPFAGVDWTAVYICERTFPPIRYVHDGVHVCVNGVPLTTKKGDVIGGIDPFRFCKLGERWFTDGACVFGQGETPTKRHWFIMRGADPATFTVLNERYAADKDAGYYITNLRLSGGDPGSFEVIGYPYARGQKPGFHVTESHYAKDSHHVYAYGVAIAGADAASFAPIGDEGKYFADHDHIYWEKTPIAGADRATFTCASEVGQYRAFDKDRVYYAGKVVSAATDRGDWEGYFAAHPDVKTNWFHQPKTSDEPVPVGGPYFSDGQRLWVKGRKGAWVSLDYIDHDSFVHIVGVFGADQSGLRYCEPGLEGYERQPVKGADPSSFAALGNGWYRCAKQAYYMNIGAVRDFPKLVVVKADMASFRLLGGAYAMDAKGLIVEGVRKRDIDNPAKVKPIGDLFARRGDVILFRGKVVKKTGAIDLENLRSPMDRLLIDDVGHMLLGSRYRKPVPGINAAALRFVNAFFAVDDQRLYALNEDSLAVCEGVDVDATEAVGTHSVSDGKTVLTMSGNRVTQEALG